MDEEKDVYNLPIAAFTFGKNGQPVPYFPIPDKKDSSKDNKGDSRKNISISFDSKGSKESNGYSNEDSERRFSFKNILKKNANTNKNNTSNLNDMNNKNYNLNLNNNNFDNNNYVFIDKEDSNSSYLKIILYSISYMKLINNYFLNELELNDKDLNSINGKVLLIIRDILIKIDKIRNTGKNINNSIHINNIINIEKLKEVLLNIFKSRKKFQKYSIDDPIDFLFVIINSLHFLKLKKENNINSKTICSEDCFSHKHLNINILKINECECKGRSNKILIKNNYFIDIPINLIINKYSKNNIYDINQKLFIYYKHMMTKAHIHIDCPKFGNQCNINKVHYKYILKNTPSYLIFNLENDYFKDNQLFFSLNNILRTFILIPHILNINSIFDSFNNTQNYYELIGILFLKISKVYTCMFKLNNIFNYYEDNIFISFNNYFDIIIFCMKNGLIPVSLFYQNIDLNIGKKNVDRNSINHDINYELNKEQLIKLEKYVKNTNSLNKNLKNKIRTSENIISDNYNINYKYGVHSQKNNNNNLSLSDNYNSSRYSGSVNSFNSQQKNEYICNHCERINKIENKKCSFCGYDNNSYLKNINMNLANNIIRNIKKHKQKKNNSNKNILNKNISLTQRNENRLEINQLGEIEDEYRNIDPHVLKYFDMPMAYIPQPNIKNEIKNPKQSPKLNNKIPRSNNNNNNNNSLINNNVKSSNMISNKINFIRNRKELMKMNTPQLILNSESNTIENNILNTINPNDNIKRNFNTIHKKRNSNSDNIINNNNYYSELNNNQLNINLKINNNNNYNIFDFRNKNNIINFEDYEQHKKENNNFTNTKKLKNFVSIKNKIMNKYNNNDNDIENDINLNFNKNNNNSNNDLINKNKYNLGMYYSHNDNDKWICQNCLNENNKDIGICLRCKMNRIKNKSKKKNIYNSFNSNNINNKSIKKKSINNNILNKKIKNKKK